MKTHSILSLLLALLLATARPVLGQRSGQISYEVVWKVDVSKVRIIMNGEQIKPGDPNFPTDIPDTRTFGQKVTFDDNYAKESRDVQSFSFRMDSRPGDGMSRPGGGGGIPQTTNFSPPFEEKIFVDLANQKTVTLLTVGKDKDAKAYRAEVPIQRATDWQLTEQTKKIAGYTCRKATVPFKKETYTVWFTTELPITYSPIRELTPATGVALLIESSREQFKATKVNLLAIDAKDVQPPTEAQSVTPEQLTDLRQKATADFQQKMMMGERN